MSSLTVFGWLVRYHATGSLKVMLMVTASNAPRYLSPTSEQ